MPARVEKYHRKWPAFFVIGSTLAAFGVIGFNGAQELRESIDRLADGSLVVARFGLTQLLSPCDARMSTPEKHFP